MSTNDPSFVRERPSPLRRLFFRAPIALYRGWLGELLRWRCVLRLTTIGRKSGRPRTTLVSFMPQNGHYVIFSGWGVRSDWYQNLLANPEVTIQVGRRRLRATAQPVREPERRRALMLQLRDRSGACGPPRLVRPLLRLTGVFDYDREIAIGVEQAEALPVVELIPHAGGQRPAPRA
jgi:deazaflavin-dependent oxidoreductase (nitroreductase family)